MNRGSHDIYQLSDLWNAVQCQKTVFPVALPNQQSQFEREGSLVM